MARGRGRKAQRGGGHTFSRDLILNDDGVAVSSGADKRWVRRDKETEEGDSNGSEDESEEDEESEEEPDQASAANPINKQELDTAAARAAKKAKKAQAKSKTKDEGGSDSDDDLINPNRVTPKTFKASDLSAPKELSRREREAKEKKEAAERYKKMHAAGKTDEAKADLARLAAIRKSREEALAKRKAEQEVKEAELEAKKVASKQKR